MNIFLWILQVLLALHTLTGAVWKFSNPPAQTMPSLGAIPNEVWIAMAVFELLCSLALILPAVNKSLGYLVPITAAFIATEMLLFCGLHFYSGSASYEPVFYWIIVAAICTFIAYGRLVLKPFS